MQHEPGTGSDGADVTPPAVSLISPASGAETGSTPSFSGVGGTAPRDKSNVAIELFAGGGTHGAVVASVNAPIAPDGQFSTQSDWLAEGTYTARARQGDSAGNTGYSEPRTFTVAPTLLAVGDIAACDSPGSQAGAKATAALVAARPAPIAALGDLVYEDGTAQEFSDCYDPIWGPVKARTRPAPGNHEYKTPGAAGYFGYFGTLAGDPEKGWYSYDLGSWHIVALNTSNECGAVLCGPDSPQVKWLRQDLAAHPTTCTLAYWHHPRFSSTGSNTFVDAFWRALYDLGADVVLSGHWHNYERFAPLNPDGVPESSGGIREFVVGTGGRGFHPFGPRIVGSETRNNDTFGVLQLTLRSAGYDWRFVPQRGRTFTDTGSGDCH